MPHLNPARSSATTSPPTLTQPCAAATTVGVTADHVAVLAVAEHTPALAAGEALHTSQGAPSDGPARRDSDHPVRDHHDATRGTNAGLRRHRPPAAVRPVYHRRRDDTLRPRMLRTGCAGPRRQHLAAPRNTDALYPAGGAAGVRSDVVSDVVSDISGAAVHRAAPLLRAIPPRLAFTALIGPPAAGKSTVSRALVERHHANLFRLRTFAETYQQARPEHVGLFDTHDALGWFQDPTVSRLLTAAFLDGMFPADGLVILEGFPGSAAQLRMLAEVVDTLRRPLVLVDLNTPDEAVAARAAARRVCTGCDPISRADPRQPAAGAADAPAACTRCRTPLTARRADEPDRLEARLRRYRRLQPEMAANAESLGLDVLEIGTRPDPDTTVDAVVRALRAIPPFSVLLTRVAVPAPGEGVHA